MLSPRERNKQTLDQIAYNIGKFCRRWGRISVTQTKEKNMTVRVYCSLGSIAGLHGLIYPGYVYNQFPKWLWTLDIYYISRFFNLFSFIITPYQKLIYNIAYWREIIKYPHLFDEITSCADFQEVLGFYIPYLCSKHSEDYKKTHYFVDEDRCEECIYEKSS